MLITILDKNSYPSGRSRSGLFLKIDNWNDFGFLTVFGVFYVDSDNIVHDLGAIKLGYFGQEEHKRQVRAGDSFEKVPANHFSVGTSDEYYTELNELGAELRDEILNSLNDIAKNSQLLKSVINEPVFEVSFLRGVSLITIEEQFFRLAHGLARLTPYSFIYTPPSSTGITGLRFDVQPSSNPPTNIHVLIGKNGVGKTFIINHMIEALVKGNTNIEKRGSFLISSKEDHTFFANLICVTFSVFDEFEHPPEQKYKSHNINYSYIGLKSVSENGSIDSTISEKNMINQLVYSISVCRTLSKTDKWNKAIEMLGSDPRFRENDIVELMKYDSESTLTENTEKLFKNLSTGHKLVLLTITRLVEKLEEKSLVLMDEPESHLHPPLLSAFMRALVELFIDSNAVGIFATHSPVVLQEVPSSCVWKLRKGASKTYAERLKIESFGENVGVLTHEIFGLEVTDSGFHNILKKMVQEYHSYEDAMSAISDQLGLEARSILRGMFYEKEQMK